MSGLENQLFQLKFTAKQLNKQAKQCQRDEGLEKKRVKKAMQDGNMDGARIYADNAIRKKNEALKLLQLSSRIDGVASRVQTAVTMQRVTGSMSKVVKSMDSAMKSMSLEKISFVMEKFEEQFEDLDVQTGYMEGAMAGTTTAVTPQTEVNTLLQQVADENNYELEQALGDVSQPVPIAKAKESDQDAKLSERLKALRQ